MGWECRTVDTHVLVGCISLAIVRLCCGRTQRRWVLSSNSRKPILFFRVRSFCFRCTHGTKRKRTEPDDLDQNDQVPRRHSLLRFPLSTGRAIASAASRCIRFENGTSPWDQNGYGIRNTHTAFPTPCSLTRKVSEPERCPSGPRVRERLKVEGTERGEEPNCRRRGRRHLYNFRRGFGN